MQPLTGRWLVALAGVAVGAASAVYGSAGTLLAGVPALVVLVIITAALWRSQRHTAMLLLAVSGALAPMLVGLMQVTPILGVVVLGALLWRRPEAKVLIERAPPRVWLIGATVTGAVLVFALWWHAAFIAIPAGGFSWSRPQLPVEGLPLMLGVLVLAAAVNSLFEELLWRVVLADLPGTRTAGRPAWMLFVAAGFGLSHLHGTPGGWIGVVATFCFGLAMISLRRFGQGTIVVCMATHFVADLILLWGLYG